MRKVDVSFCLVNLETDENHSQRLCAFMNIHLGIHVFVEASRFFVPVAHQAQETWCPRM